MSPRPARTGAFGAELIQRIFPARSLIHIGAGLGVGTMHQWHQWQVANAWVIDASEETLQWAKNRAATQPGWTVKSATLADVDGAIDFHRASNPAENGIIEPACLVDLWPNLKLIDIERHAACTLDTLLANSDAAQGDDVWLIVDCLPALRILQGGVSILNSCHVVWARVILSDPLAGVSGASLREIEAFLTQHGFRLAQVQEGNHPEVGEALFVCDWTEVARRHAKNIAALEACLAEKAVSAEMNGCDIDRYKAELDSSNRQRAELGLQCETLNASVAEMDTRINEAQLHRAILEERCEALRLNVGELDARLKSTTEENQQLIAHNASLAKVKETLAIDVEALAGVRNEQAKLSAQRLQQITSITQDLDAANGANEALRQSEAELNAALASMKEQLVSAGQAQQQFTAEIDELRGQISCAAAEKVSLAEKVQEIVTERNLLLERNSLITKDIANLVTTRDEHAGRATDLQTRIEQLTQALDAVTAEQDELRATRAKELATLNKEHAQIVAAASQSRTELDELRTTHAKELETLKKEHAQTIAAAAQSRMELGDLRKAHADQAALILQQRTCLDALEQEKAALLVNAKEISTQERDATHTIEALNNEIAQIVQAHNEKMEHYTAALANAEQLQKARDDLSMKLAVAEKSAEDKSKRIEVLDAEIHEKSQRQRQLIEEMLRAEAQLDLIKDVLLREQGL